MNALSARPARVASQRNVQQPIRSPRLAAAPRSATPRKSTTTCSLIVAGVPIPVPEMAEGPPYGIYAALGASAASFVGTFFVAPQFKDQFKQVRGGVESGPRETPFWETNKAAAWAARTCRPPSCTSQRRWIAFSRDQQVPFSTGMSSRSARHPSVSLAVRFSADTFAPLLFEPRTRTGTSSVRSCDRPRWSPSIRPRRC